MSLRLIQQSQDKEMSTH